MVIAWDQLWPLLLTLWLLTPWLSRRHPAWLLPAASRYDAEVFAVRSIVFTTMRADAFERELRSFVRTMASTPYTALHTLQVRVQGG